MEPALSRTATEVARVTRSRGAFELKGVMSPLTVMRLKSKDLNLIDRQLRAKAAQMPQFFRDAPVVVDPSGVEGGVGALPLQALVVMLRSCGVVPVGIVNVAEEEREAARAAGLGLLTLGQRSSRRTPEADGEDRDPAADVASPELAPAAPAKAEPAKAEPAKAEPAKAQPAKAPEPRPEPVAATVERLMAREPAHLPTVVVRDPVRSGQEIYARRSDLIVLAPVNPGAQIWADGNIHVYSTLRGRAMAGAEGATHARLFVQKLEAEMVAVAGAFLLADEMPQERRGKPAQVYVENGECHVAAL